MVNMVRKSGSHPSDPAILWLSSSIGRASACHAEGNEIETRLGRHIN